MNFICRIEIDHNLVRGLDYYSGFVFEATSSELGAQDSFKEDMINFLSTWGKHLPAIGMVIGLERMATGKNECKRKISHICDCS